MVDGLPPNTIGATDVERHADLDTEVRDLIVGLTDTDPDAFDVSYRYQIGSVDVTGDIEAWLRAEQAAAETATEQVNARLGLVQTLAE